MRKGVLGIVLLGLLCVVWYGSRLAKDDYTYDSGYLAAVEDAKVCDADEIAELVELQDEENLLISWHNFPNEFNAGTEYAASEDLEIWCVSYDEMKEWFDQNSESVGDWTKRFEQLMGLPAGFGYTHFTAFTVDADAVYRPAYQTDPQQQLTEDMLDGSALGEYQQWFAKNETWSYETSVFPWTRLGYTYDWAEGYEKGLSEFILKEGAPVKVEWTVKTSELIEMLEKAAEEE